MKLLLILALILTGCATTCKDYVSEKCKKQIPGTFQTYETYLETLK